MNDYFEINKIKEKKTDKEIHDYSKLSEEDQKRVKLLRIPPNWDELKISKDSSSKVQVTGKDARGRTQYIYHPVWTLFSKDTKYSKMNSINFNTFDSVIKRYSPFDGKFTKNYIIANMFILMKDLNIRVGNEKYLEENDSVGLCTLQKTHYKVTKKKKEKKINESNESNESKEINKSKEGNESNSNLHKFVFNGKKGVLHEKILKPEHVVFIENIIKIPGKSLFKYYENKNENDNKQSNKDNYHKVQAEDLNQFLKEYVSKNMTCKDIRTYYANEIFKKEYSRLLNSGLNPKKARIEATKVTAHELGNTPKVCRDSYIDPSLYIE